MVMLARKTVTRSKSMAVCDRTVVIIVQSHGHVEGIRGHVGENCGHMSKNHGHVVKNHGCVGHVVENCGQIGQHHGHSVINRGHVVESHGHVAKNHCHLGLKHGLMAENHGYMEANHGRVVKNHGHVMDGHGHVGVTRRRRKKRTTTTTRRRRLQARSGSRWSTCVVRRSVGLTNHDLRRSTHTDSAILTSRPYRSGLCLRKLAASGPREIWEGQSRSSFVLAAARSS